jgi:hypothetical protein
MTKALAPKFEYEDRPYGYRYAALRALPDDKVYARVNNFVMPWYGVICAPDATGPGTVFFSTPVDDVTHRAWFAHLNPHRPLGPTVISISDDVWNWPPLPPGTPENNWGQNRDLMKRGHATGFPQHLATEDFVMFLGQGPIADRTNEQLCSADGPVLRVRSALMKSVKEFISGKTPAMADREQLDYAQVRSVGGVIPQIPATGIRSLSSFAGLDLAEALARASGAIVPPRKRRRHTWHEVFDQIERGPIPFVAALHGAVVGGGLELAMAAHLRVCDESTFFGLPGGQRGIFVGGGGTVRIQRVVGTTVMTDMMLTGRLLNSLEGLQEHLVRYVEPAGMALTKAKALAQRIA